MMRDLSKSITKAEFLKKEEEKFYDFLATEVVEMKELRYFFLFDSFQCLFLFPENLSFSRSVRSGFQFLRA